MGKKELKTNAMRILEKNNIPYSYKTYECEEFTDGIHVADQLGLNHDQVYKTLTTVSNQKEYFVFVIPIQAEIDFKKAAKVAGVKSLEMLPLKELTKVTGYVRGGCTAIGMKKNYPVVIQEDAQCFDQIYVSGGKLGMQIQLRPDDLLQVSSGKYADVIRE